jgi:hypothetical protein
MICVTGFEEFFCRLEFISISVSTKAIYKPLAD